MRSLLVFLLTDINKRFKSLPFRSPPGTKNSSFQLSGGLTRHPFPIPTLLTPVESSDDGLDDHDFTFEPNTRVCDDVPHHQSDSSGSSVKDLIGDDGDMDMTDSQPRENGNFSSPQPWQRPRSNDMLSPPRLGFLLDRQPTQDCGRIPTPIYGHFDNVNLNAESAEDASAPSTLLSPMIKEEDESAWWHRRRLPSPVDASDDLVDHEDHNRNGIDPSAAASSILEGGPVQPDGPPCQLGNRRTARLIMGYRADCDKCIRRVPGHYSHIVWD